MSTVNDHHPRRVVRRRRPALDLAYELALAELPIELRPMIIAYVDAQSALAKVRGELATAKIPHRVDWHYIDRAAHRLSAA